MRKLYLLFAGFLLSLSVWAQERTVTGTVTAAEDGSVIPGVNVILKGTTTGVPTDANGAYSISVPGPEAILTYSFIGRQDKDVVVGDQTTINVSLSSITQEVDEVVVTGVGIERERRSLGYSVQSVSGGDIVQSRETNVVNALNSKVAGVQVISSSGTPGASASIRIRGTNSISGDYNPLFVIDGVPIDNSEYSSAQEQDANVPFTGNVNNSNRAVDINPNDVESMTVLKGPAATAIYGIRAANGAVIITTKKGKGGASSKGFNVSLATRVSIDQINKLPKFQQKYSQGTGGNYRGPETGTSTSWGAALDTLVFQPDPEYVLDRRGRIVGQSQNPGGQRVTPFNNAEDFFVTGVTQDYNLSISGGTERSNYYASINKYYQTGIVPNTDFNKTSLRFTAGHQVTNKLNITGSINYINSGGKRAQQGSNTSGVMLGLVRTPNTFDNSNGVDKPWLHQEAYLQPNGRQRSYRANPAGAYYDNPYFTVANNLTRDIVDRYISYLQLRYDFTPHLNLLVRPGIDQYSDTRRGGYEIRSAAFPEGRVFQDRIVNRDINNDVILGYDRSFGAIDLRVNVGHNVYSSTLSRNYTQGDGLALPNLLTLANASTYTTVPSNVKLIRYGVYGDVTLGIRDRYFINLTGRNDWTSTLAAGNNSFFYPAVSLGYVFTEDLRSGGILNENSFFSFGKLRLSAAQVGRDASPQSIFTIFGQGLYGDGYTSGVQFPYGGLPGYGIGTGPNLTQPVLGNPDLRPEINRTYEGGLELRFFRDRLTFDGTLYIADNRDQIILAPIASSTGLQYQTVNTGQLQNKGIELSLTGTPVEARNFRWSFTANYTRNISKVIKLAPGVDNLFLNGFTGSGVFAIPGQPFSVFYGTAFQRDGQGRLVMAPDEDGVLYPVVDANPRILGDPNPTFLFNMNNRFDVAGFYLSFLIDVRVGGKFWNGTKGAIDFFGTGVETETRGDELTLTGVRADADGNPTEEVVTSTIVRDQFWWQVYGASFAGPNDNSMERVDWFRLRQLNLGYTLPNAAAKKIGFSGMEIGVYARNLLLITDYSGVDPETNLTGTSQGFGLDYFNNPNTKTYGANLVFTF